MKKNIIIVIQVTLIVILGVYSYVQRVRAQESEQMALLQTEIAKESTIRTEEAQMRTRMAQTAAEGQAERAKEALENCK